MVPGLPTPTLSVKRVLLDIGKVVGRQCCMNFDSLITETVQTPHMELQNLSLCRSQQRPNSLASAVPGPYTGGNRGGAAGARAPALHPSVQPMNSPGAPPRCLFKGLGTQGRLGYCPQGRTLQCRETNKTVNRQTKNKYG